MIADREDLMRSSGGIQPCQPAPVPKVNIAVTRSGCGTRPKRVTAERVAHDVSSGHRRLDRGDGGGKVLAAPVE